MKTIQKELKVTDIRNLDMVISAILQEQTPIAMLLIALRKEIAPIFEKSNSDIENVIIEYGQLDEEGKVLGKLVDGERINIVSTNDVDFGDNTEEAGKKISDILSEVKTITITQIDRTREILTTKGKIQIEAILQEKLTGVLLEQLFNYEILK